MRRRSQAMIRISQFQALCLVHLAEEADMDAFGEDWRRHRAGRAAIDAVHEAIWRAEQADLARLSHAEERGSVRANRQEAS